MTVPVAWRDDGLDGKLVARLVNLAETRVIVVATGEVDAAIITTGIVTGEIVNQSENIMVGGGGD